MLVLLTSGLAASGTGRMLGLPQEPACGPEPARAVLVFKCGGGFFFFFFLVLQHLLHFQKILGEKNAKFFQQQSFGF